MSSHRTIALALLIGVTLAAGCAGKGEGAADRARASQDRRPAATGTQPGRSMTRMSTAEARRKAPFKVLEPTYLPAGARYVETRYIEFDGQVFVVLQYEFEGEKRYFQVDEYAPSVPETDLPGMQEVQVGPYKGTAVFQHAFTVVRWTQDGTRLMLNGAIDEAEALKVARSFK